MVSACRPAGLAKKLKTRLVVESITVSHLENALDMSKDQAASFVRTYYANEDVRFDRSKADAYDDMLLKRSTKMIGTRTYSLLGADKQEVEAQERHAQLQSNMDRLEQKMQEQHKSLLVALQALTRTTSPTQGSTSAPQTISARHARTGQPDAVYNPCASNGDDSTGPVNGGSMIPARDGGGGGGGFFGQGSRDLERQTPPRRSIQAQHSTAHAGAQEGPYHALPPQTRAEVQATSYAHQVQTGARPVLTESGEPHVFPADFVFWR